VPLGRNFNSEALAAWIMLVSVECYREHRNVFSREFVKVLEYPNKLLDWLSPNYNNSDCVTLQPPVRSNLGICASAI